MQTRDPPFAAPARLNLDRPSPALERRLLTARFLAELGELDEAERLAAAILEEIPEDLGALSLFAKVAHMRGALSQAVVCWAQIHARSPHNEVVRMELGAIMRLAQDPAGGAGDYLLLGGLKAPRPPAAHLELAEAFQRFLFGDAAGARARCAELARRSPDAAAFKLAVMADAWIAELGGDLEAAAAALEALGRQTELAGDTDRLLGLVGLYERLGTRGHLEAAVEICRHLESRFEKLSLQSRLGLLYRRLGDRELAARSDERFLEAFRRRMHRPTLVDLVRVAAARYLPLERLRAVRLPALRRLPALDGRERALAAFLTGDELAARRGFTEGRALLDRLYLADLLALEGDTARAIPLYLLALEEENIEPRVLGWLLEHRRDFSSVRDTPSPAELFGRPEIAARARRLLEEAIRQAPLNASLWRQLAAVHELEGGASGAAAATTASARALALTVADRRASSPLGRVLAAGVYHFVGKAKGLIHELWAGRNLVGPGRGGWLPEDQILGNLVPEMKQAVRSTFLATREYARAKFPHLTADILDHSYTFRVMKEDEPSGGLSAGLPTALAFLSVFLQRPVAQDVASSGVLVTEAHDVLTVRPVGEAEYKVKGAYNRNLKQLVLPAGNRPELMMSTQVPRAVCDELVRYAGTLDEALIFAFGEDIFHGSW